MTEYFFGVLIVIGIILIIAVSLYPEKKEEKEEQSKKHVQKNQVKVEKPAYQREEISSGRNNFSWFSPNGSWITTKVFIIGIALLVVSPMYISFKWNTAYLQLNLESISLFFHSIEASVIPLNTWTKGDFLFIIVYMSILLILVNLPTRYSLTKKGISYGLFGLVSVSSQHWSNISCFDIDSKNVLHIWFKPPLYKPDWSIKIPAHMRDEIAEVLLKHSFRYSMEAHEDNSPKLFNS